MILTPQEQLAVVAKICEVWQDNNNSDTGEKHLADSQLAMETIDSFLYDCEVESDNPKAPLIRNGWVTE